MADKIYRQDQGVERSMLTRYQDMGDGTHAQVVAAKVSELADLDGIATDIDHIDANVDTIGQQIRATYPATTDDTDAPAANTAAVITLAAQGGLSNVIGEVYWSYDDTPTGGELTIEDGAGTTVFQQYITAGGPGFFQFLYPKRGTANTAMIVTLAAGGAGISGTLNITAWTV